MKMIMNSSQARKIGALVIGVTVAGSALAWGGGEGSNGHQNGHRNKSGMSCDGSGMHGKNGMGGMLFERMSGRMDRELAQSQVRTLAEARLINLGNDNLKIGDVKTTDTGYNVTVVTVKSGDVVRSLDLGKNGMPKMMVDRYEQKKAMFKAASGS